MEQPDTSIAPDSVRQEERRIEAESAVFHKELGLRDLVLTQILFVVGTVWVGTAAKLGNQQLIFWLLAMALFYVPLAVVVVDLNRRMPLEGGLYQWAKLGFNDFVGYLVAWNLWVFGILVLSAIGLSVTTGLSYALGPGARWIAESRWVTTGVSSGLVLSMVAVSVRGLGVGKWVHNAGGAMLALLFLVLILVPWIATARGMQVEYHPLAVAMPALSLFSLNIFTKMALGALTGFEYVAILAGECRAPVRNIGRSVIIASPIIALMFVLGTNSVLAFVRPDDIDLISPIPQTLSRGFGSAGFFAHIASIAILLVVGRQVALTSLYFVGNARLPMVAGWDGLLPAWFTRLHAKFKTPVNATLLVGAVTLAFGLLGILNVGMQEGYQILDNAAIVLYGLTYVALFAIPLFCAKRIGGGPMPLWTRIAAASGLGVTLLGIVLTAFPIIQVANRLTFAAKIMGATAVVNAIGAVLFVCGRRRRS